MFKKRYIRCSVHTLFSLWPKRRKCCVGFVLYEYILSVDTIGSDTLEDSVYFVRSILIVCCVQCVHCDLPSCLGTPALRMTALNMAGWWGPLASSASSSVSGWNSSAQLTLLKF
jgi:hypothetical protein